MLDNELLEEGEDDGYRSRYRYNRRKRYPFGNPLGVRYAVRPRTESERLERFYLELSRVLDASSTVTTKFTKKNSVARSSN